MSKPVQFTPDGGGPVPVWDEEHHHFRLATQAELDVLEGITDPEAMEPE